MSYLLTLDGEVTVSRQAIPNSTRAHAFVALGKICLENQTLAQKCISLFARELEMSPSSVIRNNVCRSIKR